MRRLHSVRRCGGVRECEVNLLVRVGGGVRRNRSELLRPSNVLFFPLGEFFFVFEDVFNSCSLVALCPGTCHLRTIVLENP